MDKIRFDLHGKVGILGIVLTSTIHNSNIISLSTLHIHYSAFLEYSCIIHLYNTLFIYYLLIFSTISFVLAITWYIECTRCTVPSQYVWQIDKLLCNRPTKGKCSYGILLRKCTKNGKSDRTYVVIKCRIRFNKLKRLKSRASNFFYIFESEIWKDCEVLIYVSFFCSIIIDGMCSTWCAVTVKSISMLTLHFYANNDSSLHCCSLRVFSSSFFFCNLRSGIIKIQTYRI